MIRARPLPGFITFFEGYLRRFAARSFRGIWIDPDLQFPERGFIAAPNHSSWWDGFVPFLVQRSVSPKTPFYILMDDTQLRRFPFFRWGGAFSIDTRSTRSARDAIVYAAELASTGAGVWIFPQGRLEPSGSPLHFSSGFVHAARLARVPIVPVALAYGFLGRRAPDAFLAAAKPLRAERADALLAAQTEVNLLHSRLQAEIASGSAAAGRRSIVRRLRGIDESVSALTSHWGRAL